MPSPSVSRHSFARLSSSAGLANPSPLSQPSVFTSDAKVDSAKLGDRKCHGAPMRLYLMFEGQRIGEVDFGPPDPRTGSSNGLLVPTPAYVEARRSLQTVRTDF